ncbi:MAG: T9SS type A sorting domain-containing protein, partial [Bacteroidota bacterium]
LSDFYTGSTVTRDPSERDESKFVKLTNLSVIGTNAAEYTVADENGNQITVDDQSNQLFSVTPPSVGSKISSVQGFMFTNSNSGWTINPIDQSDYSVAFAPNISNVARLDTFPTSTATVGIQAKITSKTSALTSVKLIYSFDGVYQGTLSMTTSDSIYNATIPAANKDSAVVAYYILASNADGLSSMSPGDTINNKLFYVTHNRPIIIQDVQFTPFPNGNPSFIGNKVTVRGIATSDRTIYGAIYIQNGTGPWSAIRVLAKADSTIRRGDDLTVTGWVRESFGLTVLDTAVFVTNSTGNTLPQPTKVKAADVKTGGSKAEWYESVLLKIDSVYVVNVNEDAISNGNFGEFGILEDSSKTSGLRVDDYSPHFPYTNDSAKFHRPIQLKRNDYFSYIVGPLDYSFSNFKLVPRDSADFGVYKTITSVKMISEVVPAEYSLNQNYPNPFNPSTTIRYSLKTTSPIMLTVYNIIGQEVATLVNNVQTAGSYSVTFDAARFASGVYFYKLQAGSFISIKKMMLLK